MTKPKNILFIVSRLPINLETGDRVRVYHFMKGLHERGHRVDMVGFVPDKPYSMHTDMKEICRQWVGVEKKGLEFTNPNRFAQLKAFVGSLFKGVPYRVWQWHDERFIQTILKLVERNDYDVIHFSSPITAIAFHAIKKKGSTARLVFDFIDAFSRKLNNAVSRSRSVLRPFQWVDSKRLRKLERDISRLADETIIISPRDKKYIGLSAINVIPNGITITGEAEPGTPRDIDLLFTGNMATEPNIDAMHWFVKQVMPDLLAWNPSLTLCIAGVNPPRSIQKLESEHIEVTGHVESLDEYYRRAKIFVCPMRLGAGQKNKILEAMSNHCPVLSTAEGNLGINAPSRTISIANSPEEFLTSIKYLLNHEADRNQMAGEAYEFVRTQYAWNHSIDLLEQCYKTKNEC